MAPSVSFSPLYSWFRLFLQLKWLLFPPCSVCVRMCMRSAEFISRSNWDDISALQIKLFRSSYSFVLLFLCSPSTNCFSFSPGQKPVLIKSIDPKNKETITSVFIWSLCDEAKAHSEWCDLQRVSNGWSIAGRNPSLVTSGWRQFIVFPWCYIMAGTPTWRAKQGFLPLTASYCGTSFVQPNCCIVVGW